MSKGSGRRPAQISAVEMRDRWEMAFGQWKLAGECPQCGSPIWAKDGGEDHPVTTRTCGHGLDVVNPADIEAKVKQMDPGVRQAILMRSQPGSRLRADLLQQASDLLDVGLAPSDVSLMVENGADPDV